MSSTPTATCDHPVAVAFARAADLLDDVASTALWSLSDREVGALVGRLAVLESKVAAARARVLAHADAVDVGTVDGSATTEAWLAHATLATRTAAGRDVRLARSLHQRWLVLAGALAAGDANVEQARVVAQALDDLPDSVDAETREKAERCLVDACAQHDARELRVLGRHVLDVAAPEVGEAEEARRLEAEERRAAQLTRLTMSDDGQGLTHGRFTIPEADGARLRTLLFAVATRSGRVQGEDLDPVSVQHERRVTPARMGQALCEVLDCLDSDRLPSGARSNATVVVTMSLDSLMGGLAAATLDTGTRISAEAARHLACRAGLVPAVLDRRRSGARPGPAVPVLRRRGEARAGPA